LTQFKIAGSAIWRLHAQAAIAAVHAESSSPASTDWRQISLLYNRLLQVHPSPVVELNRAVAIAMCKGPEQGLRLIEGLLARKELANFYLAHSAQADLYRRLGGFRRRVLPIRRRLHCSRLAKIVRNRSAAFSPGGFRNWNKTILKEKSRKSSPLLSIFSTCHD